MNYGLLTDCVTDNGVPDLDPTATTGEDFLTREKAALGEDATQFASGNDSAAFVEDDEDDLLGGNTLGGGEINEFQSSFPAIDTSNNVSTAFVIPVEICSGMLIVLEHGSRRHNHRQQLSIVLYRRF